MKNYVAFLIVIVAYLVELSPAKVCIGVNDQSENSESHLARYADLKLRFDNKNCTVVLGSLLIAHVELDYDISFLNSIEEVTGNVWIYGNSLKSLSLPNLRLIRGDNLKKCDSQKNGRCSLIVRKNPDLQFVEFQNLRAINKGDILFSNNTNLCDTPETVNWEDLMGEISPQRVTIYKSTVCQKQERSKCSKECHVYKHLNASYCWTTSKSSCQPLNKCKHYGITSCTDTVWCYPKSLDMEDASCCSDHCLGGCYGPTEKQCHTCLSFRMKNKCQSFCPPREMYDRGTSSYIPNPNFHFELGNQCVKKCPEHYFVDKNRCVLHCNRPDTTANGDNCVDCTEELCPKVCDLMKFRQRYLTKSALKSLTNCTILRGSLYIFSDSVDKSQNHSEVITWEDLQVLRSLREVTEQLKVVVADFAPWLTNLTFLENIEKVGTNLQSPGIKIFHNTHLEFLGLRNLKRIVGKQVFVESNPSLCYSDQQVMKSVQIPGSILDININQTFCKSKNKVCHIECDPTFGCWGPGPSQCAKCSHFKAGRYLCVTDCSTTPGYLQHHNGTNCTPCHKECLNDDILPTCSGPGANHCLRGCNHVTDGQFCVSKCPVNKFVNVTTGLCELCSPACTTTKLESESCSGPSNMLAKDGCNFCSRVLLTRVGKQSMLKCLNNDESCPTGSYMEVMVPTSRQLLTYPILDQWMKNYFPTELRYGSACLPCLSSCKSCKTASQCDQCLHYREERLCRDNCSTNFYESEADSFINSSKINETPEEKQCLPCHDECLAGCSGPLATQCHQCRNFRAIMKNSSEEEICVSSCPSWAPYYDSQLSLEKICSNEAPVTSWSHIMKFSPILIILLLIALSVFWSYKRSVRDAKKTVNRNCSRSESLAMEMEMLSALPNMATLLLTEESSIDREYIVGSGAFGTVFKGTWLRPCVVSSVNDIAAVNIDEERQKIPVAIKVLSDVTDPTANKNFIEEAKVMATVSHPCCVQILAICLTAQPQIVCPFMRLGNILEYVRDNKHACTSRVMLQWASQIASGMAYLEFKDIIHRDLAARNVLLQTPTQARITDFGLAKCLSFEESSYKSQSEKMPIKWLAIECLRDKVFSHKSDVWAFGVTLWEILTFGKQPYSNLNFQEIYPFLEKGQRLPQPTLCSLDLYTLMIKCWLHDPEARISFDELKDVLNKMLNHPNSFIDFSKTNHVAEEVSTESQPFLPYYNMNLQLPEPKSDDCDGYLVPISNTDDDHKEEKESLLEAQSNPLYMENQPR